MIQITMFKNSPTYFCKLSSIQATLRMNIKTLHKKEKSVSTKPLFKGEEGKVTALQILKNQQLKEHITKVPALLICLEGKVIFNNVQGAEEKLAPGDYVNIEPMVKHWVNAVEDSHLILFK